ncbi:hypothetical protein HD806DRAFT_188638 [Xylariaceae sp. AK1471]|nr:hypothetical protein HD806DRAFT_188638 [Xylariaceae sp. AK1471]
MPARRPSKISPPAVAAIEGRDTPGDEPRRKRSKVYDENRIGADIRAVYPNWMPVDPGLLVEHGFAGSPSSTPSPPLSSHQQDNPMQSISHLCLDSFGSSQKTRTGSKARGRVKGGDNITARARGAAGKRQVANLRNAEHDIPEISDGAYAAFLDRHGQRPEYFPHTMLRRLESERQKRSASSSSLTSLNSSSSQSTSSSLPEELSRTKSTTPKHVWIVTHTHQGGYERFQPIVDASGAGSGVRFHGVFSSLEDANVKAMETFQKLHRDFLLYGASSKSLPSLGFGLLGCDGLGFLEMAEDNDGAIIVEPSAEAFFERHPASQGKRAGINNEDDVEGASWWLDATGCLSLRARNWGTGDSRIFVVRQEFSP